jgi:Cu-processing system permease protein
MISYSSIKPLVIKELADARKSRWLLGYALTLGALGVVIASIGSSSSAGLSLQMFGRTTATLINLCLFIAPLVAVTLGAGTVSGEKDLGTLEHLLALPIERSELLVGKYVGLWLALVVATLAGFAPAGALIGSFGGALNAVHFLLFPLLAILVISAMLAVGVLISVRSGGRAQAQTFAILIWFAFVIAFDLVLLGSLSIVRLPAGTLGWLLLLNPIDAGRILTIIALDPELYVLGPAGAYLVQTFGVPSTVALLLSSLGLWTVLPLYGAHRAFRLPVRQPFLLINVPNL